MFLRIHFAFDAVEQDSADAIQVPIDGAQGLVHNAGGRLRSMLGFIDQLQQVEIFFRELAFALREKIASDLQEFFAAGMRCGELRQQLFIEQRGEAFFTVHESQDFKAGDPAGPAGEAAGVFVFRKLPPENKARLLHDFFGVIATGNQSEDEPKDARVRLGVETHELFIVG